jgi:colanic acid/amylovoran biosynthesis glycosyltransferase
MNASDPTHWHKIVALPLGVGTHAFSPGPPREGSRGERFGLISVGRLSTPKGYPLLIEAVDRLRARGRDVELALVGEGPARSGIETRSRQRNLGGQVSFVGACNQDRVADYCRESDTFVLSSFPQGVPAVLMEAMAIEPPCVATWMTGIPEIIKRDVQGPLVPPASPAALADAIERIMDDPDSARRLGSAGRQKILSKYHLGRNVERLAQEFRELVAEERAATE